MAIPTGPSSPSFPGSKRAAACSHEEVRHTQARTSSIVSSAASVSPLSAKARTNEVSSGFDGVGGRRSHRSRLHHRVRKTGAQGSWRHLDGDRGRGRPALEETLPRGWAVDGTGRPTTDPEAALTGALATGQLALCADASSPSAAAPAPPPRPAVRNGPRDRAPPAPTPPTGCVTPVRAGPPPAASGAPLRPSRQVTAHAVPLRAIRAASW